MQSADKLALPHQMSGRLYRKADGPRRQGDDYAEEHRFEAILPFCLGFEEALAQRPQARAQRRSLWRALKCGG